MQRQVEAMTPWLMVGISLEFSLLTIFFALISQEKKYLKYFLAPVILIAVGWSVLLAYHGQGESHDDVDRIQLAIYGICCLFSVLITGLFLDYMLPMFKKRS